LPEGNLFVRISKMALRTARRSTPGQPSQCADDWLSFRQSASTPTDLLKAVAGGLDVVASAGEAIEGKSNPTTQVIVRKDSPIKSPADLKGKAIAAPTVGAVIHVATLYWLKKNGVDPSSIRAVEVPFPNIGDQLKAGNVDAVEALEPFTGALLAAG